MNYPAYIAGVKERLTSLAFTELTLPADLAGSIALALEREESWGRLIIALATQVNLTEPAPCEALLAAAGAWVRSQQRGERSCHLVLVFPFDRKVTDAESAAITRLRQDGPDRRWSVIPWTADLEVELLDRHSGFPQVDAAVARALTEVPRGAVEALVRRSTGPRLGRPRLLVSLDEVPATRLILAFTIAYYLWALLMGSGGLLGGISGLISGADSDAMIRWGANLSPLVFQGQQWRLLTHIFLHFGLWHLAMNMWALWSLGRHAEMIFGTGRMAFIYLVAGVSGGIASAALRPTPVFSAGASGAVLGLLGALIYFGSTFKNRPINWHGLWGPVALNLLFGFFVGFVDNYAHIGGFLGGALAACLAGAPGQRQPWRIGAMAVVSLLVALLVAGVIPLPHLGIRF